MYKQRATDLDDRFIFIVKVMRKEIQHRKDMYCEKQHLYYFELKQTHFQNVNYMCHMFTNKYHIVCGVCTICGNNKHFKINERF